MLVCEFLSFLLDDCLEDARIQHAYDADRNIFLGTERAIAECREAMIGDRLAEQVTALLNRAQADAAATLSTHDEMYWYSREVQIEWVAGVVSILLINMHLPPIIQPTREAALAAAKLIGTIPAD